MAKKFGPYKIIGPTADQIWDGDTIKGVVKGKPLGDMKVDEKFSDDWTELNGTTKKLAIKVKFSYKRVKVTEDYTEWEGVANAPGVKVPIKMTIFRDKLLTEERGETSEDRIEPPISDEDWDEFIGKKEGKK